MKHRIRNDVLLIAALLLLAAIGLLYLYVFRAHGDTVTVTVDGTVYGVYPLSQDDSLDIVTGEDGSGHNHVVIKDGSVTVDTATCPDGICVAHAPIFRDGESIVCLPNGVVVTVTRAAAADEPDIVV